MVGWLCPAAEKGWFPRLETVRPLGQPLLMAALPPGKLYRRLQKGGKALKRQGVRRVLLAPELEGAETEEILQRYGLQVLDPLPLCRAKGADLALCLLEDVPPEVRKVVLRGEVAGGEAWALADALCPLVGRLLLDFQKGEEALSRHLRNHFGAAVFPPKQGLVPQLSLELDPMPTRNVSNPKVPTLRLWGSPDLQGLTIFPPEKLPEGLPLLPFLTLLWETGRVRLEELTVNYQADCP